MIRGIDISGWQAQIDWGALPQDRTEFVFVKATGGGTFYNKLHEQQVAAARAAGKIVGHYHYAHELTLDAHQPQGRYTPIEEAQNFLTRANVQPGDLVALDIEDPAASGDLSNWALQWLNYVEQATGVKPFFYSYPDYMQTRGLTIRALNRWPLWFATYWTPYKDSPVPRTPGYWDKITIWQWTGGTPVAGIAFPTDENIFFGTREELQAYGTPGLEVDTVPFQHAPGFLHPIVDTFDWGRDSAGIITKRTIEVFNDQEGKWYRGTWTAEQGITWEVIGEVGK